MAGAVAAPGKREIGEASLQLLRILVRQNQDALRGLHAMPPADVDSAAGRRHLMTIDELVEQTAQLNERLDFLIRNPPAQRRRRSWRDVEGSRMKTVNP